VTGNTANVTGGTIVDDLLAWDSGKIYPYGSSFSVGRRTLNYGDSLRDYGTYDADWNMMRGIITGTLQDGSSLNNDFWIRADAPDADIIVIPEPATLLLVGLGAVMLRSSRQKRLSRM